MKYARCFRCATWPYPCATCIARGAAENADRAVVYFRLGPVRLEQLRELHQRKEG